jgi:hypothetical protein
MVQPAKYEVKAGDFVGRNFDYYVVSVDEDVKTDQVLFNKFVATLGHRAMPVILGTPSGVGPYTVKFAIEHSFAWMDNPSGGNLGVGGSTGLAGMTDMLASALTDAGFTNVTVTRTTEIS